MFRPNPVLRDGLKMSLTDRQARTLRHGDKPVFDGKVTGRMLTTKRGAKRSLRFTSPLSGRRSDAGLGTYPETSIAEAREKALAMRKVIDGGGDPIERRNHEQRATALAAIVFTFEKAARKVHEELKPSWRNAEQVAVPPACRDWRGSSMNHSDRRLAGVVRLQARASGHLL
ncbi:MAG: Arm DNA-binding domain-containing protein [Paraburkholderia sp.]|jgi:hypothetical protein